MNIKQYHQVVTLVAIILAGQISGAAKNELQKMLEARRAALDASMGIGAETAGAAAASSSSTVFESYGRNRPGIQTFGRGFAMPTTLIPTGSADAKETTAKVTTPAHAEAPQTPVKGVQHFVLTPEGNHPDVGGSPYSRNWADMPELPGGSPTLVEIAERKKIEEVLTLAEAIRRVNTQSDQEIAKSKAELKERVAEYEQQAGVAQAEVESLRAQLVEEEAEAANREGILEAETAALKEELQRRVAEYEQRTEQAQNEVESLRAQLVEEETRAQLAEAETAALKEDSQRLDMLRWGVIAAQKAVTRKDAQSRWPFGQ